MEKDAHSSTLQALIDRISLIFINYLADHHSPIFKSSLHDMSGTRHLLIQFSGLHCHLQFLKDADQM